MIIGVTGMLGAGKGEVANYLVQKGFKHFSVRTFLEQELSRRNLPSNRDTMTVLANELRQTKGTGYIAEQLFYQAQTYGGNAVIESIRSPGEIEFLRKQKNFFLFGVDADPKTRYGRISLRASNTDAISYEKFLSDEARESQNEDPTKQNLPKCLALADFVFDNNGSLEDLHVQIDQTLFKIGESKEL